MFSRAELSDIIHHVPTAPLATNKSSSPRALLEAKLRRFYTYFCVKETYIKLVGEGLLADWIKECEFRNVQVPMPLEGELWGEKVTAGVNREQTSEQDRNDELEIWLRGKEIRNVRTEMQAFEDGFVIASMMTPSSLLGPDVEFPPWKMVDLENDVLHAGYGE
jgi:4'-phosphopantetheinyl transferase